MSLLLQALQKAARNREDGSPRAASAQEPSLELEPPAVPARTVGMAKPIEELTLEDDDFFEPGSALRQRKSTAQTTTAAPADASTHSAATIMRAGEVRSAGLLDVARDYPVPVFAAIAALFALGYGVYVYLQISHPGILRGDFLAEIVTARTPPPAPMPAPAAVIPAPADTTAATLEPIAASSGEANPSLIAQTDPAVSVPPLADQTSDATPPAAVNPVEPTPAVRSREKSEGSGPRAATSSQPAALSTPLVEAESEIEELPPPPRRKNSRRRARVAVEDEAPELSDSVAAKPRASEPAAVTPALSEAYTVLQEGRLEQALALYQSVAQADPYNVDAALGLATIAARRGSIEAALPHYERALELEPHNAAAQAGLIEMIGQADPGGSETRLKQLIAREPAAFLYFGLGNLYAKQHNWAQAQQAYFQAYQMQSDNADYAYNLAVGLEHLSQPKLALTYYHRAAELSELKGHANFDRARVLERIAQLSARLGK